MLSEPTSLPLLVGSLVVLWAGIVQMGRFDRPELARATLRLTVWTASMLVWPMVWRTLTAGCSRGALVGLIWPYVVFLCDNWRADPFVAQPWLRLDASSTLSLSFALAGLVGAQAHRSQSRLFVLSIIVLMCVVLPSAAEELLPLGPGIYPSLQRVALAWCVGLLLSGALYHQF